jgi:hypothetical protein
MRLSAGSVVKAAVVTAVTSVVWAIPAAASSSVSTPGVTATSIRVGIPYVDLSSLASLGIKLTQGSYPDAYNAVIANLNAHGGIDGRKIVPYLVAVNPTGTAAAATACTQLTEDDKVFVAIAPLSPGCYLQQHHTPTIQAQAQGATSPGSASNFTLEAPAGAYDPLQLSVFDKEGVFKGKKVGLYGGTTGDEQELAIVQSALKKLHVDVVQSAVNDAPATDQTAENQDFEVIAQRFQNEGVNEVVGVGDGSVGWPQGSVANQSNYNPPWVATDETALDGYVGTGGAAASPYLAKVVTSVPVLNGLRLWQDPGVQKCVSLIHKAYPSDTITAYSPNSSSSDHSYISAESACQNVALFAVIAKAAGKDLTVSSFTKAAESLKNFTIPASGGPVSFASGEPYALGPVYVGHYDPSSKTLVFATKSANTSNG